MKIIVRYSYTKTGRMSTLALHIFKSYIRCVPVDVNNVDSDCWNQCGHKQGPCDWCGADGICCTVKTGWTDTSNGCDGSVGGQNGHQCVPKPAGKINISRVNVLANNVYIWAHIYEIFL